MKLYSLFAHARARLERALNRHEEQLAAARYLAATGHDAPPAERARLLHVMSYGAPQHKHRVS